MSAPGRKKHHHEEHEEHVNHEAWVIPYADMLTLLMAMFLVLWAIGQVDINKAKAVSSGFADQFGLAQNSARGGSSGAGVLDGSSSNKKDPAAAGRPQPDRAQAIAAYEREQAAREVQQASTQQLEQVKQQIQQNASKSGLMAGFTFRMEARGLVVSISSDSVLFDSGSAVLTSEGQLVLAGLADVLSRIPNQVSVEGHTDNVPIATSAYPSNWELSTARATSVLRYLVDRYGLSRARLSAAGYADQRPLAGNDTAAGRTRNRRVDIAVLMEGASAPTAGTNYGDAPTDGSPSAANPSTTSPSTNSPSTTKPPASAAPTAKEGAN